MDLESCQQGRDPRCEKSGLDTRLKSGRVSKPLRRLIEEDDCAVEEGEEGDIPPLSSESELSSDEEPCNGHSLVRSPLRARANGSGDARSRSPISRASVAWKNVEEPDVAPKPLKFTPRRTPGVQAPLNVGRPTPIEIFSSFFDTKVFWLLCANINLNAARNKKRGWKYPWWNVTVEDMRKFIGLLLYMAVLQLPKLTDLWRRNSIFSIRFPPTVMSRDRFRAILSALHVVDPADDVVNEQTRGEEHFNSLHRLRPLLELIRTHCMAVYQPRQQISVDERMVATKAKLSFKQYMKDKPTKRGLKFFVLADSNGYTVDYWLHTGRSKDSTGNGLSFDVVTSLVNKAYLGTGYIIYCDNFYTSPRLFTYLGEQGFGACGTYRQGRIGVPKTEENALTKKSPRGSIRWIREGSLLFVKWMDTKEVSLCSTVHSVYDGETVLRWKKDQSGKYERGPVPRPTAVREYKRYMGGVDTSNQMLGTNLVQRKTRHWYVTVIQHLLDIAVTNSFIIAKELAASRGERLPCRLKFQEELCAQLLGPTTPFLEQQELEEQQQQQQKQQQQQQQKQQKQQQQQQTEHLPICVSQGQNRTQRASMGRRRCTLCKRSTPWQCEACGVGLCLQLDRNCFRSHHKDAGAEV